jgi:RPA family protein
MRQQQTVIIKSKKTTSINQSFPPQREQIHQIAEENRRLQYKYKTAEERIRHITEAAQQQSTLYATALDQVRQPSIDN